MRVSIRSRTFACVRVCRVAVLIGSLAVAACVHHAAPPRRAPRCLADVLYFGRNIPGHGRPDSAFVSSAEWHAFADTAFRRWLPNGSSETDAEGRYVADGRWVAESTKVVTIVHIRCAGARCQHRLGDGALSPPVQSGERWPLAVAAAIESLRVVTSFSVRRCRRKPSPPS